MSLPTGPLLRLAATALVVATTLGLTSSSPASAHARVQTTAPSDGAVVPRQPQAVSFTFDEPVEGSFGAVRAFDARSRRVDTGATYHPGQAGQTIAVRLRPGLPQGTYTATFRALSADGHPVAGGFTFSVGEAGARAAASVGELAGKAGAGPATSTAFAAVRALQYLAIAVSVGLLAFLLLVTRPVLARFAAADGGPTDTTASVTEAFSPGAAARAEAAMADRTRALLAPVAALGALTAVLAVLLEGAVGSGTSFWTALDGSVIRATLSTRFGLVWSIGAALWIVGGLVLPRARRLPVLVGAAPLVLLVALPSLGGHAATLQPIAVFLTANLLHVAAISTWFGGLVALLLVLPRGAAALQPAEALRLRAAALPRFSTVALASVVVLVAAGTLQATLELTAVRNLWDSAFGRAISVKVLLLAAAGAFALRNHRRAVPAIAAAGALGAAASRADGAAAGDDEVGRRLRRAVRAEVALVVLVFAAAGALAGYPPPTQASPEAATAPAGPVDLRAAIGPNRLRLTVDPAAAGANRLRLVLTDAAGRPLTSTQEVTISAVETTRGIGPLALPVRAAGPGTFAAPAAVLPAAGNWRLTVVVRVSEFDEFQAAVTVAVR